MAEPEPHIIEDEAALYVLGQLGAAECRAFEARLQQSAELRALVREFEAGAVALALATPQHQPPPRVWQRIEDTVAEEMKRKIVVPAFWGAWLRNGWATATACLLGWLLYALWVNRAGLLPGTAPLNISQSRSPAVTPSANSVRNETANIAPQPTISSNVVSPSPQLSLQAKGQIAGLRRQVADLENQMTHLSQVLTQQQTLLIEPSRPRFFQLAPASAGGQAGGVASPPSPALQRALLLALARELGWLRPSVNGKNDSESQRKNSDSASANNPHVEFVDLPITGRDAAGAVSARPGFNELAATPNAVTQTVTPSGVPADAAFTPESVGTPAPSIGAIPGFVSGTNVVLALDASVAPSGASFTLLAETDNLGLQPHTTLTLGTNPVVVTMPLTSFTSTASVGGNLAVTAGNVLFGPTNLIVRPPLLGTNAP